MGIAEAFTKFIVVVLLLFGALILILALRWIGILTSVACAFWYNLVREEFPLWAAILMFVLVPPTFVVFFIGWVCMAKMEDEYFREFSEETERRKQERELRETEEKAKLHQIKDENERLKVANMEPDQRQAYLAARSGAEG